MAPDPLLRTSRAELIQIQRDLVERLKREINRRLGYEGPKLDRYYRQYRKDIAAYRRTATFHELVGRVLGADIVYQGDYHTLDISQETALRVLEAAVKVRPEVTIAVESVCIEYQDALDDWMKGRTDDHRFLEACDYERTWGFSWKSHRRILDFAREHGLPVLGINSDPSDQGRRIRDRDKAAAEVLARAMLENPQRLVYVVVGDLHVSPSHLPASVDRRLARTKQSRRRLVVYQNVEAIYWQLAEAHLEQSTEVVEVADDVYCVVSSTPLVRLQSYFSWAEGMADLPVPSRLRTHGRDDGAQDVQDLFHEIAATIADFFELEADLESFELYTSADLDFLSILRRGRRFDEAEVEDIARQIAANESYFIPGHNIVYLATPSLNHAAEEAAHFVHTACAGSPAAPLEPEDDFYRRALYEAIGFIGSKVINPRRECADEDSFVEILDDFGLRRKLTGEERILKAVARGVLRHRDAERRAFRSVHPRRLRLRSLYEAGTDVYLGVTTCLGYILGCRLYDALLDGRRTKADVAALFRETYTDEGAARRTYMELARELERRAQEDSLGSPGQPSGRKPGGGGREADFQGDVSGGS